MSEGLSVLMCWVDVLAVAYAFVLPTTPATRQHSSNATSAATCALPQAQTTTRGHLLGLDMIAAGDSTDPAAQGDPTFSSMRVRSVLRYPIKGGRAEPCDSATVSAEGLVGDRRFMVTTADGKAVTQREQPGLATIEAKASADQRYLSLRAADGHALNVTIERGARRMVPCTLFGEQMRLWDQGAEAGMFVGAALKTERSNPLAALLPQLAPAYRLVHAPPAVRRAGLADLSPVHLICEESLAALNARRTAAGGSPTSIDRFRPNLVVSGCGKPHAEDEWKSVRIGAATFRVSGPCPRCTVPDVSQATGKRDVSGGPMTTLGGYRARAGRGVLFGIYLDPIETGASVRVGDGVTPVLA